MKKQHASIGWGLALLVAAFIVALVVDPLMAHGRRGGGRRVVVVPRVSFGFYGAYGLPYFSPYFSNYYGYPYYGPYRQARGGMNPALARALDVGALDLDIKPRKAEVFVDGVYVGIARDFDGGPSYLWLDEGEHAVVIYKGGYASYEAVFDIEPGVITGVKVRMTEGASEPPTRALASRSGSAPVTGRPST